jgi:hypothetical protein
VILVGFIIPNLLSYFETVRLRGKIAPLERARDIKSELWGIGYLVLCFSLGFFFMIVPNLYME